MKRTALNVRVGCCGWSYLEVRAFGDRLPPKPASKLAAYAHLFDAVEVNSTFYRIPRPSTGEKWRESASSVNPVFEFTVKAFQGITHIHRFRNPASLRAFQALADVTMALNAGTMIFQSPASFRPTSANIDTIKSFFALIRSRQIEFAWEPRGEWLKQPALLRDLCSECGLIHCVDPLRDEPVSFGIRGTAYFRLHGFGKPSMYRYDFSEAEIERAAKLLDSLPDSVQRAYVFFNNVECYRNAIAFREMLELPG